MNEGEHVDFVDFVPKMVAMATSLEQSGKESRINNLRPKYLSFRENLMNISSVDLVTTREIRPL